MAPGPGPGAPAQAPPPPRRLLEEEGGTLHCGHRPSSHGLRPVTPVLALMARPPPPGPYQPSERLGRGRAGQGQGWSSGLDPGMALGAPCPSLVSVSSSIKWGRLMCRPRPSLQDSRLPVPFLGGSMGSRLSSWEDTRPPASALVPAYGEDKATLRRLEVQ